MRTREAIGPGSIGRRLLVSIVLVLVAAAATAWLVATLVGPALFHEHLVQANIADHELADLHIEEAFQSASTIALGLAMVVAGVTALTVSVVLTRRVGRSVSQMARAAAQVGSGRFDARVPLPGIGVEFDQLAGSFNTMAAHLEADERLRERLLTDVAHELRTPAATLTAYVEALEDGVRVLDTETITVLNDQAQRLTRLASDLAAVTRAESGELDLHLADVPAGELVEAAALVARERAETAGVTLTTQNGADAGVVRVDRVRMAQVLDNLAVNAIRHTPAGGRIILSAGRRDATTIELTVTDTGEGIAAEHLPHLFERFYRVDSARDRRHGGSGVGLAICRALVQAHGGTIDAASEGLGRGSRFSVRLPDATTTATRA
ncbi:ATP-binding protein [Cellulomonas sp. ACRRI]|uniref:sensor histidine kinase n=1 Tax=Cellulomonas sp. ACRRI TaxID=2918188 RepID=UPI001C4F91DF|nr:ATP-binding protein [Cellulomonas sp. ACRRI]MBW0254457.1 HAMP domain-containing protein [Cellulomonas sp. PS-H5]MCG7284685.1 ATP-binding protein [Cellulomonas sp. ACRRI]